VGLSCPLSGKGALGPAGDFPTQWSARRPSVTWRSGTIGPLGDRMVCDGKAHGKTQVVDHFPQICHRYPPFPDKPQIRNGNLLCWYKQECFNWESTGCISNRWFLCFHKGPLVSDCHCSTEFLFWT
jgi:hypothetical protein